MEDLGWMIFTNKWHFPFWYVAFLEADVACVIFVLFVQNHFPMDIADLDWIKKFPLPENHEPFFVELVAIVHIKLKEQIKYGSLCIRLIFFLIFLEKHMWKLFDVLSQQRFVSIDQNNKHIRHIARIHESCFCDLGKLIPDILNQFGDIIFNEQMVDIASIGIMNEITHGICAQKEVMNQPF
jgi:hypothetical protein